MNQEKVWKIIVDHTDFIGAVVYKTVRRYTTAQRADLEEYRGRVVEELSLGRLAKWDPAKGCSLKTWIAKIANQVTINELERRKICVPINHGDIDGLDKEQGVTLVDDEHPLASILRGEQGSRLSLALDKLTPTERKLFRAICNETTKELGLTPVQLCRARKRLIDRIQELL